MRSNGKMLVALAIAVAATGCGERTITVFGDAGPAPDGGPRCGADDTECGGSCVDTDVDPRHCGGCGMACGTGEICAAGTCEVACPSPLDVCADACVDTTTNPMHCGGCGTVCDAGEYCDSGTCVTTGGACEAPRATCGGTCVDTASDPAHCGACDTPCEFPNALGACAASACFFAACDTGFVNCDGDATNGCEVDSASDALNCGACGNVCGVTQTCTAGACVADPTAPTSLSVTTFETTSCVVASSGVVGDDRGGVATGNAGYYILGDDGTARYGAGDLTDTTVVADVRDGIVSDLGTGALYSLTSGGMPLDGPGTGDVIDGIVLLDPSTMAPTGAPIALSAPITIASGSRGIFAGIGFMVFANAGALSEIALPAGTVTSLGTATLLGMRGCENWAAWGVAERSGTTTSLLFAADSTVIRRETVGSPTTTDVLTLASGPDLCSFSVDLARARWVYHHEYSDDELGPSPHDETAGYCPITFTQP